MREINKTEFKLLTDIISGWDSAKLSWMLTDEEAEIITSKYQSNIIPLLKNRTAVTGEVFEFLIGYALIIPLDLTEDELIEKERSCSHVENWALNNTNASLYYLPEMSVHKDYRYNGMILLKIMKNCIKYCKENNIDTLYTTAVSDDTRMLMRNQEIKHAVELIAVKENKRVMYKINIGQIKN